MRAGFTLIEVLIVIGILLAIGGLVLVNLMGTRDKAEADIQVVQFDQLGNALDQFKLHLKRYPTEEEGLNALMSKDAIENEEDATRWAGPYLREGKLRDSWNHEIVYHFPSEERGEGFYDLISPGPDGEIGTEDDITNHDRMRGEGGEIEATDDFAPPGAGGAGPGAEGR